MCGIAGYFDVEGNTSTQVLVSMTNSLVHRGPDAGGELELDVGGHGRVGLGHRRLAIIDLTPGGNQPMSRGELHIVFNGEIYNYEEIKSELVSLGHSFKSSGDTEVILASVQQWGMEAAISRLNGMFAFAMFDSASKSLFLVRDRAGVKPLYFFQQNGLTLFASELKSFSVHPKFDKSLSDTALTSYFRYGYVPGDDCIYRHCAKVPPGHFVQIDLSSNTHQVVQYWDVCNAFNLTKLQLNAVEALDELEALMKSAVQYRMVSDVPVGVFLSGGYDSSVVTALLGCNSAKKIRTFTIGFEDRDFDEAPFARAIAERLGTDHTEYTCNTKEAQEIIPHLADYFDEPFGDSSAIPTILVSRIARQSVKVALSADAGDELFGGYNKYATTLSILRLSSRIPGAFRNSQLFYLLSKIPLPKQFGKRTLQHLASVFGGRNSSSMVMDACSRVWGDQELSAMLGIRYRDRVSPFENSVLLGPDCDAVDRMLAVDYKTYLPDDILTKVDRATMSVSLEGREPLLDYRLAEFAARLPSTFKVTDSERKKLLKDLTHRYIPQELLNRPKKGFSVPYFRWLRGELKYLVDEYLSPSLLRSQGVLNPAFVIDFKRRFDQGDDRTNIGMWNLLMFQMWQSRWGISSAS